MRLIDADELEDFFFSETSGTEEFIRDLMDKHNLTYLNDVNEDEVMDFAIDLIKGVQNVIDTQETAFSKEKVIEELDKNSRCMTIEHSDYKEHLSAIDRIKALEIVERGVE